MARVVTDVLSHALEVQSERLLACVHCGFCLPACPTYNRLGDEADSPRGRLHLMRAVVDGRLDPGSDAFQTHIDRCLGCRACEPVCPSGVEYGALLELARDVAAKHRPPAFLTRLLLLVFGSVSLRRAFFLGGRLVRGTGLAALGARVLPGRGLAGSARLGLAMLAASAPWKGLRTAGSGAGAAGGGVVAPSGRGRVAVLLGCVQEGLFGRVNDATVRVLEANGYEVVSVAGQDCCGALHAHGGDLEGARNLARINVARFEAASVDRVVVNAAGCGAAMKQYGDLLREDASFAARAAALAKNVRDVTEILAEAGPRRGAPVPCRVAYDHPCHLLHAQRIQQAPLKVLAAVPGAEVRVVDDASECCGGAGIYGITHPDLGGRIGGDKIASVRRAGCDVAATPNPGCMMQIGAGLRLEGASEGVIHPVELLDESYRRAGYYA
ncbi:MAG: heterodisulfide reductase-related iron-sulfur binding cluster [Longimicrobiales bacterium]|nr:heterodisulfide reductase-related iron-sulfur binding cluster [Longimicrobiales bacterium]